MSRNTRGWPRAEPFANALPLFGRQLAPAPIQPFAQPRPLLGAQPLPALVVLPDVLPSLRGQLAESIEVLPHPWSGTGRRQTRQPLVPC